MIKGKLIVLCTYAQREVWSFIQSVQVSLMIFALEGSYHYSSQAGLQDFILGGLNGQRTAEGRVEKRYRFRISKGRGLIVMAWL